MSYFCCYAIVWIISKFQPNIWFRDLPLAWEQARLDVLLVLYVLGVVGSGGGEWQWRNSQRVPEHPGFSNPFLLPCCYLFGLGQRRKNWIFPCVTTLGRWLSTLFWLSLLLYFWHSVLSTNLELTCSQIMLLVVLQGTSWEHSDIVA